MDKIAAMDTRRTTAKVSPRHDLTATFDAPFASIKSEPRLNSDPNGTDVTHRGTENNAPFGTTHNADNKTETFINGISSRISPMRINHRAQIDVVEMRYENSKIYKNLLIYEEQYSKFVVLRALRSSDASEVAVELADIVTTIGAPRIVQSGNGRDYAEQVVREMRMLLGDFCVVHGDATRNGEVRRDFKLLVESWMTKNPGKSWHEALKILQVVENTASNSRNGTAPSQLYFGRNICEDLRRTIGAKGATANASLEEDSIISVSKDRDSACDSINDSSSTPITKAAKITEDVETKEEPDDESPESKENISLNIASVKISLPNSALTANPSDEDEERPSPEKYNFRCNICQKRYIKLGHLKNHMKTHTKVGSYDCSICSKSFRLSRLYDEHMRKFHEDKKSPIAKTSDRLEESQKNSRTSPISKEEEEEEEEEDEEDRTPQKKPRKEPKSLQIEPNPKESSAQSRKSSRRSSSLLSKRKPASRLNGNPLLECAYCKQKFNFPSVLKRHMRSHTNERPYVCQICGKSFKQLGHLSQHSLTHTDYRSFQCSVCSTKFDSLDSLKLHSQSHKDESLPRPREIYRLFECDCCKKVFTTKSVLERHIFTHSHERQFGCKVCGKRFKQAGHVKSHMLVHTGERKFGCTVCSKRFSLSNSLKKHMYVHNGEKPYQCDVCGSRFLEKRNLNGHLMTHTNERPFSCKICGKRYTLADTLRRHVSAAHEDGRTYQCEICAKMFKQLAHLSVHKKVHNDERPFQCHLCEKNFKHKNVLKSHLAIHANVRPFECDLCKATFVRKTNLQTHIASAHMNERPYVCTICNKRFKQISHLNGHTVVHSNSMPYQCDFCDRRCNRLDNLKKHMRLHAKNRD